MTATKFVEFNGEWHRDCYKCGKAFASDSVDGLAAFFYRDATRKYGLHGKCKECSNKKRRPKEGMRRREKSYNKKYPEKVRARNILRLHIKSGKIKKPNQCQKCMGIFDRIDGHHSDYSRPLDVMWLCQWCHVKEHNLKKPSRTKGARPE